MITIIEFIIAILVSGISGAFLSCLVIAWRLYELEGGREEDEL
jgi:hypothetical protein